MTETNKQYLQRNGWRIVAERQGKYHSVTYWTHDNHQPSRHGFFTQSAAVGHQRYYTAHGDFCYCIPKEQPR